MGKNGGEKRGEAEGNEDDEPNLHFFCALEMENVEINKKDIYTCGTSNRGHTFSSLLLFFSVTIIRKNIS